MPFDATYLAPVATLAVGVATASFAFLQWALAREKVRLDLFEKRYRIFDATRTFITKAQSGILTDEAFREFRLGSADIEFFFGEEVVAYRNDLVTTAYRIRAGHMAREMHPEADGRSAGFEAAQRAIRAFEEKAPQLSSIFYRYMAFRMMRFDFVEIVSLSTVRNRCIEKDRVV